MNINNSLEAILKKTVILLEDIKRDIFTIGESSTNEYNNIKTELDLIQEEINKVLEDVDCFERENRQAEENFTEMAVLREKEVQLRNRRQELENRLLNLKKDVNKAENLVSKVNVISEFLIGELTNLIL